MELIFEQSDEYYKSYELIKQASEYKKTDILRAIKLINEAIEIHPSDDYYLKLANYLSDAGQQKESYDVLNRLLKKYSYNEFINMKNGNRAKIYERITIINFKNKNYKEYIKNSAMYIFNILIGIAIQGRKKEVLGIINHKPFKENFTITKINKAFNLLNLTEKENDFYSTVQNYFKKEKIKYIELCKIFESISENIDIAFNESVGEYEDRILSENKSFIEIYNSVIEQDFELLIDNQLSKLCVV